MRATRKSLSNHFNALKADFIFTYDNRVIFITKTHLIRGSIRRLIWMYEILVGSDDFRYKKNR